MSFLWKGVSFFLYCEIAFVFLLCLPFLSGKIWRWFLKRKVISASTWRILFYVCLIVLAIVFLESIRGILKYSDVTDTDDIELSSVPLDTKLVRMKDLFRAQRNFYISGFSLFLILVIYRLLNLLVEKANLVDKLKKQK